MAQERTEGSKGSKTTGGGGDDALALLKKDHDKVKEMLKEFEQLRKEKAAANRRRELVGRICSELKIHTQLEEEALYPQAQDSIDESDLIGEALVEHQSAKNLIKQIESMDPNDDLYDATVTVLGEHVKHHINEEERELFPQIKSSDLDIMELGEKMRDRKEELQKKLH